MIRMLTTVAALSLLAAPAFAGEVTVNLAGKSPAAAYAKIASAARAVCYVPGADVYAVVAGDSCVTDTVNATLARLASPALTNYVAARRQFLQMAKL